jgi:adenosylmethionine-8-amino-7-oxononanoate aminotransferase
MLELAEELRSVSPLADTWCFFNSSGSESVESAIQLVRRYWQLRGRPGKTDLISRWPSFHGSTHGALSLSGSKWRAFYETVLDKHPVAPVPNADIRRRRARGRGGLGPRALEGCPSAPWAGNVAAVVIEPVTGAREQDRTAAGYIAELRRVCDRHDALLVFDDDHGMGEGRVVRRLPGRRHARHHHVREGVTSGTVRLRRARPRRAGKVFGSRRTASRTGIPSRAIRSVGAVADRGDPRDP